jgi:hypothetical protein
VDYIQGIPILKNRTLTSEQQLNGLIDMSIEVTHLSGHIADPQAIRSLPDRKFVLEKNGEYKKSRRSKKERKRKDPRRDRPLMEKTESVIRRTIMNAFDVLFD